MSKRPMAIVVCSADPRKDYPREQRLSLKSGAPDADTRKLQVPHWAVLRGDLDDLERFGKPVVRFTRYILKRVKSEVIILSTRMREYLADHGFSGVEVQHIPNGVDISRFCPSSDDATPIHGNETVVCTSRLSYEKGLDVLLQAWQLVQKELPKARLIVAGIGPLEAQLRYLVKVLDIDASVDFVGFQSDVPSILHRGRIATLPSRWEGMPNAILEGMACGLPCVATRVSGSEDVVTDGVNGLLVEPEDYKGMARALLELLHNPVRTRAYGKAARELIEQHYSLEHIADIYLNLYRRMLVCQNVVGGSSFKNAPAVEEIESRQSERPSSD